MTLPFPDNQEGPFMLRDPNFAFFFQDGEVLPFGEKFYRKEYAKTLEIIAQEGVDAFYTGEIAESIVKCVKERGGFITLDDLRGAQRV